MVAAAGVLGGNSQMSPSHSQARVRASGSALVCPYSPPPPTLPRAWVRPNQNLLLTFLLF